MTRSFLLYVYVHVRCLVYQVSITFMFYIKVIKTCPLTYEKDLLRLVKLPRSRPKMIVVRRKKEKVWRRLTEDRVVVRLSKKRVRLDTVWWSGRRGLSLSNYRYNQTPDQKPFSVDPIVKK